MTVDSRTMEIKKAHAQTAPLAAAPAVDSFSLKNVIAYFADVKSEFYKISWTTQEELRTYTIVVVGAAFCLGFGLYGVDLVIQGALFTVDAAVRSIFG